MDCNKDEAVRAKEMAEMKVTERDYVGAKNFVLKAQKLYPPLQGISQMLATIDVYISAEKRVSGQVDWYSILGTTPWADDETLRKQYLKLALALHPDKNKYVGADGAFNLVAQAWSLLSDKAKRLAYNWKLYPRVRQKHPVQGGVSFASPGASGVNTNTNNVTSHAKAQRNPRRKGPASVPSHIDTKTNNVTSHAKAQCNPTWMGPGSVPSHIDTKTNNVTSHAKVQSNPAWMHQASVPSHIDTKTNNVASHVKVQSNPAWMRQASVPSHIDTKTNNVTSHAKVQSNPAWTRQASVPSHIDTKTNNVTSHAKVQSNPAWMHQASVPSHIDTKTNNVTSHAKAQSNPSRTGPASVPSHIDTKTNNVTSHAKAQSNPSRTGPASVPSHIDTKTNTVTSHVKAQSNPTRMGPASVPSPATFWTICSKCDTQYEYARLYLNHTLLCPNCRNTFRAEEKPPPPNVSKPSSLSSHQQHHASNKNQYTHGAGLNTSNDPNLKWGTFSKMAGVNHKVVSPSTAAQAASVIQQAREKLRKEREEAWAADFKRRRSNDNHMNGYGVNVTNQMAMGHGAGLGSIYEAGRDGFSVTNNKPNSERELSLLEIRNMLVHKAQTAIRKTLQDWSSVTNVRTADREKATESKKQRSVDDGNLHDRNKHNESNNKYQNKESLPSSCDDDSGKMASTTINVPDSDFHNFDVDRAESSFADDQVWAAYDNDDGMPRYYARIQQVISLKPFKIRISWLNSRSNSELGPINWVDSGFFKTCGDFRAGRYEISKTLNSFSHKIKWKKGSRGLIRIFPSKGDIWALYRNWSPDWNEHTPDEVIHKYDMVEVLDDYNEEQGVSIAPLVKVAGFRAVFCKNTDPKEVRRIPKEEMFRFSHQVPSHLLTGKEAVNAPVGYWELDPAATSLDEEMVKTGKEAVHNR